MKVSLPFHNRRIEDTLLTSAGLQAWDGIYCVCHWVPQVERELLHVLSEHPSTMAGDLTRIRKEPDGSKYISRRLALRSSAGGRSMTQTMGFSQTYMSRSSSTYWSIHVPHWTRDLRRTRLVLVPYRQIYRDGPPDFPRMHPGLCWKWRGGLHVIQERKTDPGLAVGRKKSERNCQGKSGPSWAFSSCFIRNITNSLSGWRLWDRMTGESPD
jgi:hypothetical protein